MRFARCWPFLLAACASTTPAPAPLRAHDGQALAEFVHPTYDAAAHAATCKPWHRIHAPDGRLLTKDLGGEFEHHRGLFVGWNQVRWRGQRLDFWHCRAGETQRCVDVAPGPDGGQVAHIDWRTGNGELVLRERRTLRLWLRTDDAYGLELAHEFTAELDVVLAGDPQHAGQQFRALQAFAEPGAPPVRYLRAAGAEPHGDDVWTGCAWIAALLPLPAGPVTVLRIEGGGNPQPATWSTRAYGRFGATFTTAIAAGGTLRVASHYVIANGARTEAWCAATAASIAARW